jgi:hypothetical protein
VRTNPRHRPQRRFPGAPRQIVECAFELCLHCGAPLVPRRPWHTAKTVQTLHGPLFIAGKSKECGNPACAHVGQHYYASQVWSVSLPYSTYGLDVLAFIGWQHEHEHRQFVEIQRALNARGILINERSVGKVYRQFLALLGGASAAREVRLAAAVAQNGGVVWAVDALQPDGGSPLLYVLYDAVSGTVYRALQAPHASAAELSMWLHAAQTLPYPVLATLSDGEDAIGTALRTCWPTAPHQRCQVHFLNNLAGPVLEHDRALRRQLREELKGLPAAPLVASPPVAAPPDGAPVPNGGDQEARPPLLCLSRSSPRGVPSTTRSV